MQTPTNKATIIACLLNFKTSALFKGFGTIDKREERRRGERAKIISYILINIKP
jgi:hypothetical protein